MAELLVARGFSVTGVERPDRLLSRDGAHDVEGVELTTTDLTDAASVRALVDDLRPTYVVHLASMSFVPASWEDPVGTSAFTVASAVQLLDAIRLIDPEIRYVGAASAEIFGHPDVSPQHEKTPVRPVTPYGAAKAHAHFLTQMYRDRYGLHCSSAILYNHESPRRPPEFLPRKVARAAAAIKLGIQSELALGSLDAVRDWSFAGDVVDAMYLMLGADEAADYVIASGVDHTVRDLVAAAFAHVGLDYRDHVVFDEQFARPPDAGAPSVGDASLAQERLGWRPTVDFGGLVKMLVDADLERLRGDAGRADRELASR